MDKVIHIEDFSPALFWDIDRTKLDFEKNKRFIIERTLTHGTLADWFLLKGFYGKDVIKTESMQIRYLDKLTLSFCAAYFNESIENFRCYILKQSNPTHWGY
ncbi:MAG: hypothetical protein SFV55_22975 [Haliscomenobacter sp.]|uniref:DUF6922 domain-containing protein n=1 Tax=Haliscomenobacter sp. TaxID=2717303 RepID=UPI0029B8807B|nr:hypothetical protein [Haliscomenobacter sp.]MDX2071309.1 hypothetical protein [Haliscomenobacter sp.]